MSVIITIKNKSVRKGRTLFILKKIERKKLLVIDQIKINYNIIIK